MPLTLKSITPEFGVLASGLDLSAPLSDQDVSDIHAGMDKYAVMVFRGQQLDKDQQLAFTTRLGPIEEAIGTGLRKPSEYRLPTTFADVSNLDKDNKPFKRDDRRRQFSIGNRLWHSDSSFKTVPAKYSLLYASVVATKGGETQFADMRAAYDALDQDTKDVIEDLICEHSQIYSRGKLGFTEFTDEELDRMKPVLQRLVRTHPSSGRKSLYLSSHAGKIIDWQVPEARALLLDLNEHATQPAFVYTHHWQVGDLVIWDNRATMHRARPFPHEDPRDMRRTTLMGDGPTVEQSI